MSIFAPFLLRSVKLVNHTATKISDLTALNPIETAMSKNFHENYHQPDIPLPPARSTGIVFTVVALIVALVFRNSLPVYGPACVIAAVLACLSWRAPDLLEPLNKVWFRIGMVLHKVVNPLVMAIMFAIAIIPMGLMMQCVRDPLRKKPVLDGQSYWIEMEHDDASDSSMMNQF